MCLYKTQTLYFLILLCAISSCTEDKKTPDVKNKYFDIRGFFNREILRLSTANRTVQKTVVHNGVSEVKQVKIPNWKNELDVFSASDLNKPSWRDSYNIKVNDDGIVYTTRDSSLKIKTIRINKSGDKITSIDIKTQVNNEIYNSTELLNYFPDSLYRIKKTQVVKLLGTNTYQIEGEIKP